MKLILPFRPQILSALNRTSGYVRSTAQGFVVAMTIPTALQPNVAERSMQRSLYLGLSCLIAGAACIATAWMHLLH